MDEILTKRYRYLVRTGFENAGSLENPSIFLDSVGERLRICAHAIHNYVHLYINIRDDVIEDIKYLCSCVPAANIAIELLCTLVKGKTIKEAESLTEDSFAQILGSRGEEFMEKSRGAIELLNRALERYRVKAASLSPSSRMR
jgi:nitrogen fixation NifU-like protein